MRQGQPSASHLQVAIDHGHAAPVEKNSPGVRAVSQAEREGQQTDARHEQGQVLDALTFSQPQQ